MNDTADTPRPGRPAARRSRRAFLAGAGGVVVAGLLVPLATRSDSVAAGRQDVAERVGSLSHGGFAARRGDRFRIYPENAAAVDVTLTNVTAEEFRTAQPHGASAAPRSGEHFTLVFRGPGDRALAQATYRFRHSRLGDFDLFIVPARPSTDAQDYVAVINRPAGLQHEG